MTNLRKMRKNRSTPPILEVRSSQEIFKRKPRIRGFGGSRQEPAYHENMRSTFAPPPPRFLLRPPGGICNPFRINTLQAILAGLKKVESFFSSSPRFDRVKFATVCYQRFAGVCIAGLLACAFSVAPAYGQNAGNPTEGDSATPARLADAERTEAQDAPAGKDAPLGAPIAADALNAYLLQIIETQGATIAALQAQVEALKGQQTLQQAAAVAQQAQQALGENVAKLAKESGAADGARLALDGTWIPPAESQATQ